MKIEHGTITFSTGKTLHVERSIVGICLAESDSDLGAGIYEGSDGTIEYDTERKKLGSTGPIFTDDERLELARHMIEAWAKWGRVLKDDQSEGHGK